MNRPSLFLVGLVISISILVKFVSCSTYLTTLTGFEQADSAWNETARNLQKRIQDIDDRLQILRSLTNGTDSGRLQQLIINLARIKELYEIASIENNRKFEKMQKDLEGIMNKVDDLKSKFDLFSDIDDNKLENITEIIGQYVKKLWNFRELLSDIYIFFTRHDRLWKLFVAIINKVWSFLLSFDSLPNALATLFIIASNRWFEQWAHDHRDNSDLLTITWHYYEDCPDGTGKNFVAVTEATINIKDAFKDDIVLYNKVKQAMYVSHAKYNYPDFCILVGRRKYWSQFICYILYLFFNIFTNIIVFFLSFIDRLIQLFVTIEEINEKEERIIHPWWKQPAKAFDRWTNHLQQRIFERHDILYTPYRPDHQLFKRRLRNVISEHLKNSLWPHHVKNICFPKQTNRESPDQRNPTLTHSLGSPPPLTTAILSSSCTRTIDPSSYVANNSSSATNIPITEKNERQIFVIPVFEKEEEFEIKQFKIILIFGKDLLYCYQNPPDTPDRNIHFRYKYWRERERHLYLFMKYIHQDDVENGIQKDYYQLDRFWTDIIVPEHPCES